MIQKSDVIVWQASNTIKIAQKAVLAIEAALLSIILIVILDLSQTLVSVRKDLSGMNLIFPVN